MHKFSLTLTRRYLTYIHQKTGVIISKSKAEQDLNSLSEFFHAVSYNNSEISPHRRHAPLGEGLASCGISIIA